MFSPRYGRYDLVLQVQQIQFFQRSCLASIGKNSVFDYVLLNTSLKRYFMLAIPINRIIYAIVLGNDCSCGGFVKFDTFSGN